MGIYLNPGKDLFRQAVNSKIYVDKSMLIDVTNGLLNSSDNHICISRPRRICSPHITAENVTHGSFSASLILQKTTALKNTLTSIMLSALI